MKNMLRGSMAIFGFLFIQAASAVDVGVHIVVDRHLITKTTTKDDLLDDMDLFIMETNEFYEDSNVDINLILENIDFRDVSIGGTVIDPVVILKNIGNQGGDFNNIFNDADRFGADYIVAIVDRLEKDNRANCGRAVAVNRNLDELASTKRAYAVSRLRCGADTFAHELGHLMGLAHGNLIATCVHSGHKEAVVPYARGWSEGDCDEAYDTHEFGTIMVGNWLAEVTGVRNLSAYKVPLFSSPKLTSPGCGADGICGDAANGDAARALNEYANIYAAHETRDADLLDYDDSNFTSCLASNHSNTEVIDLTSLNCSSFDIKSINGIEQLDMLRNIDLSNNRIVNVSPLGSPSRSLVTYINLYGNNTALCHQLDALEARYQGSIIMPESCFNLGAFIAAISVL